MSQDQSIEESLETMITYFTNQVNTCLPAKIVEIRDKQTVDVQPTIKKTVITDGKKEAKEYPIIPFVPVFTLASKDFFLSFPFKVGDPVLLIFSQHSIDKYSIAEEPENIDSEDLNNHDINNAIAILGTISPATKITEISDTNFIFGKRDGSCKVILTQDNKMQVKATSIELGDIGASKALAIAEKVDARLSALESYVIIPHGSPAGPTVPTPFIPGNGGATTASTKVKTDS